MVSDFFYPSIGGVETHIWSLSQCLIRRGHKVIVITHSYGDRTGVRYMTNGLKVYYLPLTTLGSLQVVMPTVAFAIPSVMPLLRQILIRERVSIVHGHQASSALAQEALNYSKTMGYRTAFTDHSLFCFEEVGAIHVNKLLKWTLCSVDEAISVSHTCRENLVLRSDRLNVVIVSRMTYRKGIDLMAPTIGIMCQRFPQLHFIVGGDGPKKLLLEEMREKLQLHDRVELLGAVPHDQVRSVLVRGHIFLNCSLTESFCIALVEAACCGLVVVSTRVGGVPEVLPPSMTKLAEPTVDGLVQALTAALPLARQARPEELHRRVREMYSWPDVAARTESVYNQVMRGTNPSLVERFHGFRRVGQFGQWVACFTVAFHFLFWRFLDWLSPAEDIDIAPDFPSPEEMRGSAAKQTSAAAREEDAAVPFGSAKEGTYAA